MTGVRQALVVAVDEYADEGLGRLRAPADDAEALGEVLGDPRIGDFDVRVLRNETAQGIRVAVEDFFADRRPDDLLLLHFSCHGLKNAAGQLFLAASDSRPDRLASTAVAADFVNQQMADSRAQRIALFLDCCYGGAFPRGMVVRGGSDVAVGDAFAAQREAGGRGRVVVTASSSVEYAFEGRELSTGDQLVPSVFTGSVVEGLASGEADRDGDGWVGLNELFGYVAERVRRATPHQTPHLWAFGSEGDLLLAHSRRRRVVAGELPQELLEAVDSSLSATRLGAAIELRDRLLGTDLPQALAAFTRLTGLVDDDSRRVSATAAAAVHEAGVQVEPAVLDLGPQPPGSRRLVDLRVVGPPLALAVSVETSVDWLTVDVEDGDLLHVIVGPRAVGHHAGTVDVVSPTGRQSVPVSVDVVEGVPMQESLRAAPAAEPIAPTSAPALTPAQAAAARIWWPVAAGLLLCAAGLTAAYAHMDRLWFMPVIDNLGGSPVDGFAAAILALAGAVVVALARPHLARTATGVTGGIGLFFVTWGYAALGVPSHTDDSSFAQLWWPFLLIGIVVVAFSALDLARRRVFSAPVTWVRPAGRQRALLVAGSILVTVALALPIDGSHLAWPYSHGRFLAVSVVAVALALLAATADLGVAGTAAGEVRLPAAVALAYLATTTIAAGYLAVSATTLFGLALGGGAVCLGVPALSRSRQQSAAAQR
jgi:hypothetical protein